MLIIVILMLGGASPPVVDTRIARCQSLHRCAACRCLGAWERLPAGLRFEFCSCPCIAGTPGLRMNDTAQVRMAGTMYVSQLLRCKRKECNAKILSKATKPDNAQFKTTKKSAFEPFNHANCQQNGSTRCWEPRQVTFARFGDHGSCQHHHRGLMLKQR